jgi:hypothetical protein
MATARFTLIGLEGSTKGVEAYFNPKEITIDKPVPWQVRSSPGALQYTGGEPKTMSIELMFDGFESATPIQLEIDKLDRLSTPDPGLRRPPRVRVTCGLEGATGAIGALDAVIESLAVKYTMFDADGVPVRATVGVRLRADRDLKVGKTR